MSKLINSKIGAKCPIIDKRLKDIIYFNSTCLIPENIICLFEKCFKAFADQLSDENMLMKDKLPYVTCITIGDDKYTIQLEENVFGAIMSFAVYPILKWNGLSEPHICACILEELCHFFWNIRDEYIVNFKVIEILKRIYPNIEMRHIYKV